MAEREAAHLAAWWHLSSSHAVGSVHVHNMARTSGSPPFEGSGQAPLLETELRPASLARVSWNRFNTPMSVDVGRSSLSSVAAASTWPGQRGQSKEAVGLLRHALEGQR